MLFGGVKIEIVQCLEFKQIPSKWNFSNSRYNSQFYTSVTLGYIFAFLNRFSATTCKNHFSMQYLDPILLFNVLF